MPSVSKLYPLWPDDVDYYFSVEKLHGGYYSYVLSHYRNGKSVRILEGKCKAQTIGSVRKKIIAKLAKASQTHGNSV